MKLVVKKKSVGYGVNGSDVAITDIANIATLKEGSFLIAFDNGVVVKADGSFTGTAGDKAIIYHVPVGGTLQASNPIYVGKSKILKPLTDHAAAQRVVTYDLTKVAMTGEFHSGVRVVDRSKSIYDPTRLYDYTVYGDAAVTQATLNGIAAKVATCPLVASATLATNLMTVTFKAGVNAYLTGLGIFEAVKETQTTALSYGDPVSSADMVKFAQACSASDGCRDSSIDGIIGTFTRNYGVEAYNYLVYGLELNTTVYSTGKTDLGQYGAVLYIAIPEGDLAATNEGFMDILKAATLGVSNDSGAAGADAADN